MNIASIIIAFSVIWWLVFFIALPIGSVPVQNPEVGHASSAPANPRIMIKAIITTIITIILTVTVYYLTVKGVIDFSAI